MFAEPLIVHNVLEPFPHFKAQVVFSDDALLRGLGRWLHNFNGWSLETGHFYQQYGFDFSSHSLSEEARALTSPQAVSTLLKICERAFATSFFPAIVITAHKLTVGQYINIHTDASTERVSQTHRLVVQIPSPEHPKGGDLLLFASRASEAPAQRYHPIPNTGFGFEFGAASFHAVSPIIKGTRYSLIINLKASRGLSSEQIMSTFPKGYIQRLFTGART